MDFEMVIKTDYVIKENEFGFKNSRCITGNLGYDRSYSKTSEYCLTVECSDDNNIWVYVIHSKAWTQLQIYSRFV